jgi:hypothetical protein
MSVALMNNPKRCNLMKEEMEGQEEWWKHISEDKKKAFIKAKLEFKIKKVQAKLDFLKELQKIFG